VSWSEAAAIVRRWAEISEAAARDRKVSDRRIAMAEFALKEEFDPDALYVRDNELVGRVMRRLETMFANKARPVDMDKEPTVPVFKHEEPTV